MIRSMSAAWKGSAGDKATTATAAPYPSGGRRIRTDKPFYCDQIDVSRGKRSLHPCKSRRGRHSSPFESRRRISLSPAAEVSLLQRNFPLFLIITLPNQSLNDAGAFERPPGEGPGTLLLSLMPSASPFRQKAVGRRAPADCGTSSTASGNGAEYPTSFPCPRGSPSVYGTTPAAPLPPAPPFGGEPNGSPRELKK